MYVCLPACLPVGLSACMSVCLSVCLAPLARSDNYNTNQTNQLFVFVITIAFRECVKT